MARNPGDGGNPHGDHVYHVLRCLESAVRLRYGDRTAAGGATDTEDDADDLPGDTSCSTAAAADAGRCVRAVPGAAGGAVDRRDGERVRDRPGNAEGEPCASASTANVAEAVLRCRIS